MENAPDDSSQATPVFERFLQDCSVFLQGPERRRQFFGRLLSGIRLLLRILTASYLLFLLILCVGLHWFAEINITLAFLSFLPAILWLLPLAALLLFSLPFSWRLALLQALAAAAYVWFFMDFEASPSRSAAPDEKSLTILSYNRGQHHNQSFKPFVDQVQPDIIVLQESFGRSGLFKANPQFADFPFIRGIADFVVLSKHPLSNFTSIHTSERNRKRSFAARFEVDFAGTPIALYAVHPPSLRDTLGYYRRGVFLAGILGIPGTPWGKVRVKENAFWAERTGNARELAEAIAAETIPAIAAGDFNMPDHGMIYGAFASRLNDAHEKSGRGFGYTFPGRSDSVLMRHGPWLRLDYIFSTDAWKTTDFITEKNRTSQHRAIAATLTLKGD